MDVIVKDDQGRFIPDVKKDEFEIYEDGVKQEIASMTMSHGGRVTNVLEAPPTAPPEGIILPPTRRVVDTSGRVFLFFVDDLHMQFQNSGRVRELFKKIQNNLIHEGDLFGIVSSGPSSISQDMTYDRKRFDEAIKKIAGSGLEAERNHRARQRLGRADRTALQRARRVLDDGGSAQQSREGAQPAEGARVGERRLRFQSVPGLPSRPAKIRARRFCRTSPTR